jgi:hypothetical protein
MTLRSNEQRDRHWGAVVMMYLIVPIVLIWAFVVFPSFRIVAGIVALIGVGLIFVIVQNDKEDQKNRAIKQEQERVAREQERVTCDAKRKASAEADKVNWSVVKAAQIELRDTLLKSRSYGDDYDVVASAKNRSPAGISRIRMNVVALDCPDDDANKSKCDVVGHQEREFEANIPTGEVRQVRGEVTLPDVPKALGKFSWSFKVTGARISPKNDSDADDFLMTWSCR